MEFGQVLLKTTMGHMEHNKRTPGHQPGVPRPDMVGNKFRQSHGHRPRGGYTPTYVSWWSMRQRIREQKKAAYIGVSICDRWMEPRRGFLNFLEDMGERPEGMTLDRIDPTGNYEPNNCRWADKKTQRQNQRTFGVYVPRRTSVLQDRPLTRKEINKRAYDKRKAAA